MAFAQFASAQAGSEVFGNQPNILKQMFFTYLKLACVCLRPTISIEGWKLFEVVSKPCSHLFSGAWVVNLGCAIRTVRSEGSLFALTKP